MQVQAMNAIIGSGPRPLKRPKEPSRRGTTKRRIRMTIRKNTAGIAAVAFAMMLAGGTAVAQGTLLGQKRTTGRKPIVQAKPSTPMGCKLVGTVRGTKLWAGECTSVELKPTATDEAAEPDAVGAIGRQTREKPENFEKEVPQQ
jgi:hypothetical protein